MTLPRLSLLLASLVFGAVGLWFLADPVGAGGLVDLAPATARARIDFRATYGGLNLSLAALLGLAARRLGEWTRPGLALQIGVFAGYAAGRLIGMAADAATPSPMPALLAIELSGVALGWAAWRRSR